MLVVDKQFVVAVANHATRGELHFLEKGVTVGVLLVVIAKNLQREQTNQIDDYDHDSHPADNILPVFKIVVLAFHSLSHSRLQE